MSNLHEVQATPARVHSGRLANSTGNGIIATSSGRAVWRHSLLAERLLKKHEVLLQLLRGSPLGPAQLDKIATRSRVDTRIAVVWRWADEEFWVEHAWDGIVKTKRRQSGCVRLNVEYDLAKGKTMLPFPPTNPNVLILAVRLTAPKSAFYAARLLKLRCPNSPPRGAVRPAAPHTKPEGAVLDLRALQPAPEMTV